MKKKYFGLFLFVTIFCFFLVGQISFDLLNSIATMSNKTDQVSKHYEASYQTTKFKTIKGRKVDLKKINSEIVILNFWASWCTPCLQEFPSLQKLSKEFSKKELTIIAVSSDEKNLKGKMEEVINTLDLTFDFVHDPESKIFSQYNIQAIPVSIIFHKGKVVEISDGKKDFAAAEVISKFKKLLKSK